MKKICLILTGIIAFGGVSDAAVVVKSAPKSSVSAAPTRSGGTSGAIKIGRAGVLSTARSGQSAAKVSSGASSGTASNARLSIGRLYNSSGKQIVSIPSNPGNGSGNGSGNADLSQYALQTSVDELENRLGETELRLDGRVDQALEEISNLDLTGMKGEKGDPGAQGAPGPKGSSAYEIALLYGFVGSEAQWLNSLKGEKGDKGDPGDAGSTGPQVSSDINGVYIMDGENVQTVLLNIENGPYTGG